MADEENELNHVDHKSKNVSDETISKLESSDDEINLFSKRKKRKIRKGKKRQKSTWKESRNDDLVNCI